MKKKPIIYTRFNYVQELGEINNEPDMTVPDMSLSIREIFQRFAQGRTLTANPNLHYTGDDFTPDVKKMDLTEYHEMLEANKEFIEKASKDLKDKKAQAQKNRSKSEKIDEAEIIPDSSEDNK